MDPTWWDMTPEQREQHIDRILAEHHTGQAERRSLAHANRRVLAERLHWPAGALDTCERLDAAHPGWSVTWMASCAWNGRPAGFYARHDQRRDPVYGPTEQDVETEIDAFAPVEPWTFRPVL